MGCVCRNCGLVMPVNDVGLCIACDIELNGV